MIYTALTRRAMQIAYNAHHGQMDPCGVPYIFHPMHLAEQMEDEVSCAVAILHDVVEDTYVTLEMLQQEFPPIVTDALSLLTHHKSEDYFEYVNRIRSNPIAKAVKLADLAHNSDQSRCVDSNVSAEKLQHWAEKYARAKEILLSEAEA